MRVLEMGRYIVPAYAGMILAEQGHEVIKWTDGRDPILTLRRGGEMWEWLNSGKRVENRHPLELLEFDWPEIVLDNFRPSTLSEWGLEPEHLAKGKRLVWVSMQSEVGEISFDLLAQARSWMEYSPYVPFYAGDTIGGLWMAFKALAVKEPGHYVLGHASCLQKVVEGELVIDVERDGLRTPWDDETYLGGPEGAVVQYRGERLTEPIRRREWKLKHLWHQEGRIVI